jgi:hypothetical protein
MREKYESAIAPARKRFADTRAAEVLAPDMDPEVMELFLIHFSALGVSMTRHVEDWIHRAGQRCEQVGLTALGKSLQKHSLQESGHDLMFIEDTKALVNHWNLRRANSLKAEEILAQPITPGVRMYQQLHEDVITGDTPFAQTAIEYEIEALSVRYGPQLVAQCLRLLGPSVMTGLSFLQEHVALDVGHTHFNERQLDDLLKLHPEYLMPLVSAGEGALAAYGEFLSDCLRLARDQVMSLT